MGCRRMKLQLTASMILLLILETSAARAQPLGSPPLFQQMVGVRLRLSVISGRITNIIGFPYGNTSQSNPTIGASRDSLKEQLNVRSNTVTGSLNYERTSPAIDFSLEVTSEGRFAFRYVGKDAGKQTVVQFQQVADDPLTLTVQEGGQQQVYRGPTLWHLVIGCQEPCRRHLLPLLDQLRPQRTFTQDAVNIESELLKEAAEKRRDRKQWATLVTQLGDERFANREAADRQLRNGGLGVVSYLRQLDLARLDAEQQFRIRRILKSVGKQTDDDTPVQAASMLAEDPAVWASLLSRPEVATRRVAADQLAAILGEPLRIDPTAEPATQQFELEQLRMHIERLKATRAAERP
jgi:hypothetical protein